MPNVRNCQPLPVLFRCAAGFRFHAFVRKRLQKQVDIPVNRRGMRAAVLPDVHAVTSSVLHIDRRQRLKHPALYLDWDIYAAVLRDFCQ